MNTKLIVITTNYTSEPVITEVEARETPKCFIFEGNRPVGLGHMVYKCLTNVVRDDRLNPTLVSTLDKEKTIEIWNKGIQNIKNQEEEKYKKLVSRLETHLIK